MNSIIICKSFANWEAGMSKYNTEQRQKLLQHFKNSGHQLFSAADLLKMFGSENISISAIYRNLKTMENEGLISRVIDNKRTEAMYQYVNPNSCVGIIHLKCENCENTYHINKHISNMIMGMAKDELNFTVSATSAFLYGKCENCSQISEIN